jgi:hypothetical protein
VRFNVVKSTHAAFSVFDTPFAQHALSPANALDATSIAAATNAETVILIMVNAETGMHARAFNHSFLQI